MTKKIEFTNDINEFLILVETLLSKIGYIDIKTSISKKYEFGVVSYNEKTLLKSTAQKMFLTFSELNGKLHMLHDVIKESIMQDDNLIIVTSNEKISEYFKNWIKSEFPSNNAQFWNHQDLIQLLDEHYIEYWDDKDMVMKYFEEKFKVTPEKQDDITKFLNLDKKYKKYLDIFIEPKIFVSRDNNGRKSKIKISLNKITEESNNLILSGDAGTGKSTFLKEVGLKVLQINKGNGKKTIPIFIKAINISENGFSLIKTLRKQVEENTLEFEKIIEDYNIILLIDSIDEFELEKRELLLNELDNIYKLGIRYLLGTRNSQNLLKNKVLEDCEIATLYNFDLNQIRQYLSNFFKHDLAKSQQLWQNLKENNILEKIPTTPLTLSLISILYEENGFEIPATLTDIYDNFNTLLLGRLTVKNSLDFLTITVKEKILSLYALSIIEKPNRGRLKKQEFITFSQDYFSSQGTAVDVKQIPDLIINLTDGTGILYIDENGFVNFTHDHFLEYYASREMFLSEDRIKFEDVIIEKFIEYNWQNVAIFYTGRTKDMKSFLSKLLDRIDKYQFINEYLLSVSGLGYVLQSLWLTNSVNRKKGIIKGLDLLLKADVEIKNLSLKENHFFNGINENIIALLNLSWFYNNFNSISLKDPLELAFDEIYAESKKLKGTLFTKNYVSEMYKLFCIATVLQHGRNGNNKKMEILFEEEKILTIPLFVYLFDNSIAHFELHNKESLKTAYKVESKVRKYTQGIKYYLDNDTSKTSFTDNEQLIIPKKVHLITEGRSDAIIIMQAFLVLTEKSEPYWNIESVEEKLGAKSGGANELNKYLTSLGKNIITDYDKENVLIGIFDNDEKGFQEFNGLRKEFEFVNPCLRKHENLNLYALLLPIPNEEGYENYEQEKQNLKYFAIEHYLPISFLKENNMVKDLPIPGVFEIKDSKIDFANKINNVYDVEIFKNFRYLFDEIDTLNKRKINYCC